MTVFQEKRLIIITNKPERFSEEYSLNLINMRKLGILLASMLIAGMSLESCSNDDNSDHVGSIIGKWNFSTQKITSNRFVINEGPYEGNEPGCEPDFIEFNEDHTAVAGDYSENCELETISSIYTLDKNILDLSYGPVDNMEFRIVTANETTLVLKSTSQNNGMTLVTEAKFLKAR